MISVDDITVGNEKFNAEQKEAVESVFGTFMVAAPPGSGKTFVLQKRILYMVLKHHISTDKILAITFTNEAASEMKSRVAGELERYGIKNKATISTFHSFALKMLKEFGEKAGLGRKFSLIDENEKLKILRRVLLKLEVPKEELTAKGALNMISNLKSNGKHWSTLNSDLEEEKETIKNYVDDPELALKNGYDKYDIDYLKEEFNKKILELKIYANYETEKEVLNLYDFDDLILRLRDILRNSKIQKIISSRFRYVLVDETQDIDPLQEEIIRMLVQLSGNLFCIYDDDQSIYGFRNADPNLVINLDKKIQGSKVITLKENFRSTDNIIQASNHIIKNNTMRIRKWMKTNNEAGEKVIYRCLNSKEAEAEFVCQTIEELRDKHGYSYKDFAILYRNNELNKIMEQKLIANEIPHQINKSISFFQREEIKDILSYLQFIVNESEFHLERIINVPKRGVGEKALRDFKTLSYEARVDIFSVLKHSKREQIKDFCDIIVDAKELLNQEKSLADVIDFVIEKTKYKEYLKEDEVDTRMTNIERLKEILNRLTEEYDEPEELLLQIKIMSEEDSNINGLSEGKVSLMTMHASKGRGFTVVFIIGCEQGIIPAFSAYSPEEIEEERRIMYVAMTRAKKHCFISRAKYRVNISNGGLRETKLSEFVEEIPEDLIQWDENEYLML